MPSRPEFDGELTFAEIDPRTDTRVRTFTTGDGEYEKAVNGLVAQLVVAESPPTTVAMEANHVHLAGIGAYTIRPLAPPAIEQEMYVVVIGLDREYRSRLYGGMTMGYWLLRGLLLHMRDGNGGRFPASWAYVGKTNTHSHRMFAFQGYTFIDAPGDAIRYRPPGLALV